ncbi:hypothetical protein BST14_14945 [Mycobacterium arosiense ATCC BAA-1401 = DSM 45069]|uniref:Uncharacterized protein n=1 Tax=Mycobacterium arosiense ATCC BAA-1401 = DSM 45069 TaxID=1265311 RepID=A0A1W9ZEV4_MYCAI|nr:hypothetical protein BST14_14945 [Mycobacterium arosiense ATCC BAA-1401 = DSM 45069]
MAATRCARLRRACDRREADGGDPLRSATPRLRSPRSRWRRPAALGYAALAIAAKPMAATRCARLRRACDRREADGGDPLRSATPRLRSPRSRWRRPAALGYAALAIAASGHLRLWMGAALGITGRRGWPRVASTALPVGVTGHRRRHDNRNDHDPDPAGGAG